MKITKYALLRELVVNSSTLVGIGSLYVAYLLGAQYWWLALTILFGCVLANNLIMRGWLKLIRWKEVPNKILSKIRDLPISIDGIAPRLGVDEKIVFRFQVFGYRIIIYKTRRR